MEKYIWNFFSNRVNYGQIMAFPAHHTNGHEADLDFAKELAHKINNFDKI